MFDEHSGHLEHTHGFFLTLPVIYYLFVVISCSQVADALRRKNFEGETPLLHAAGATEPGAFRVIAKTLSGNEVRAGRQHTTRRTTTNRTTTVPGSAQAPTTARPFEVAQGENTFEQNQTFRGDRSRR